MTFPIKPRAISLFEPYCGLDDLHSLNKKGEQEKYQVNSYPAKKIVIYNIDNKESDNNDTKRDNTILIMI